MKYLTLRKTLPAVMTAGALLFAPSGSGKQITKSQPTFSAASGYWIAAKPDGTVKSWGYNTYGQLGDGTTTDNIGTSPVTPGNVLWDANDPIDEIIAVSAAQTHALALHVDGTVLAWGANSWGQLGNGTTNASNYAARVLMTDGTPDNSDNPPLDNVIAVSASLNFSLALRADGTVWAWGHDELENLGDGPDEVSAALNPVQVITEFGALENVVAISAGRTSLALKADGTVWVWGWVYQGRGGTLGADDIQPFAVQIPELENIIAVSSTSDACLALRADGTVWGWGWNRNYDLGIGANAIVTYVPVQVCESLGVPLTGVISISAGDYHSLAVKNDGTVYEWGAYFTNYTTKPYATKVLVSSSPATDLGDVVYAEAGGGVESYALKSNGTFWNWRTYAETPVPNAGIPTVPSPQARASEITQGMNSTLYVNVDGTIHAWGANGSGQLGDGTTNDQLIPVQLSTIEDVISVGVMGGTIDPHFSVALKADGTVWTWGWNGKGQLGNGTAGSTSRLTPDVVPSLGGVKAIAIGHKYILALKSDGTVWGWGDNSSGQLGDGTTTDRHSPVQLLGWGDTLSSGGNVAAVSCGNSHSMALRADGTVWTSGLYQLTDSTTDTRSTPAQITDLPSTKAIVGAGGSSYALCPDGGVRAWGANWISQLGDGTATNRPSPVAVLNLQNIDELSCGAVSGAARRADGEMYTWGYNGFGQLGDGTISYTPYDTPVHASTYGSNVRSISAGGNHFLVEKANGGLRATGYNSNGQLGNNDPTFTPSPSAATVVGF